MLAIFNWPTVFVASVAATLLSAVFYLPPIFGLRWGTLIKKWTHQSDADLSSNVPRRMLLWLLSYLINAVFLYIVLFAFGVKTIAEGLEVGLIVWAGFALTFSAWSVIHANQPVGVWVMNNVVYLLAQLLMAAVLTAMH